MKRSEASFFPERAQDVFTSLLALDPTWETVTILFPGHTGMKILLAIVASAEVMQQTLPTWGLFDVAILNCRNLAAFAQQVGCGKDTLLRYVKIYQVLGLLTHISLKLNRSNEALEWIDKAKAQILRAQLVQSGYTEDSAYQELDAVTFQEIQALLSTDGAAIAIYTLSANSCAVYVYNAAEKELELQRLSLSFSLQDLQKALMPVPTEGYSYQRDPYKAMLPQLSAWLLHPLREIVNTCSVLCIVPDSLLAGIPFAALECEDAEGVSRPLIEHCAVSFVPAVAILQWCRQRAVKQIQHRCLAFGVGSVPDVDSARKIEFAAQAKEVVALFNSGGWESRYLPEATTSPNFFA